MPTQATKSTSKAGIATDTDGQRHIPSSVRADGTLRKEIKVRPGYRPPEDVEVYKNRTAEAFKNRGKGPVPGADTTEDHAGGESSAAANKNAKRREARKKAAANAAEGGNTATTNGTQGEDDAVQNNEPPPASVDPEAAKEKEARKLAKKLRQAKDLKEKKEKGDALLPEQFEKVIRINELIRQLDALGFDGEGQRKPEAD